MQFKESAGVQIDREVRQGRMLAWSGVLVDPLWPTDDTVRIDDIAHALSLVCRYAGHVDEHYSVGRHSLEVSYLLRERMASPLCQLMGLLHDAEEAYFGDMSSPLKKNYPDYRKHGEAMRNFIWDKYIPGWQDVPSFYLGMVHQADQDLYQIERMTMQLPYEEAEKQIKSKYNYWRVPIGEKPKEVESKFHQRFNYLIAQGRVPVEGGGTVSPKSDHERHSVQV